VGRDGATVKYAFKGQALNLPTFTPGAATVTIKIGSECYEDSQDTCVLSSTGRSAKCQ
jgi:hypothetical protein